MRIEKFTNLYRDVTKEGTKIPQEKYCLTGQFPIVDQGQRVIAGWWNDDAGIFKNVPALIFGDHTRAIKYMEQPFFIGADGVKILRPTNIKDNPKYLYYALQAAKIPNLGYSRHFKVVKELQICIYSREEQNEIVRVLEKIDYLIEQRHAETTYLDQLVKSRFIELFGEPLSNQKGWQTMSIVEAAPIKSQRGDLADEVWLLNLDAVEAQTGTVLFKHRVQSGEINASTVYFTAESVLYSKLRPYLNKVVMPDEDGVATSEMIPMYPLADRLNRAYLCYWLRSDAFVRHISEKVAGAKMPRVSMDYFRSLAIEMPPLELQEQFAAFVEQTDKSKYYSSLSFRYCQAAVNTYRQEWMTCRTSDF